VCIFSPLPFYDAAAAAAAAAATVVETGGRPRAPIGVLPFKVTVESSATGGRCGRRWRPQVGTAVARAPAGREEGGRTEAGPKRKSVVAGLDFYRRPINTGSVIY